MGAFKSKFSFISDKAQEVQNVQRNYTAFLAFFITGVCLFGLSFLFIPTFVIYPQKISMLINLGSICIISSFGALKGFYNFFMNELISPEKRYITALYLLAVSVNMYASVVAKSYILTIVTLLIVVLYTLKMMKQLLWFW